MEVQPCFLGKNKKNILNLLSAELAKRVIKVNFFTILVLELNKYQFTLRHIDVSKNQGQVVQSIVSLRSF